MNKKILLAVATCATLLLAGCPSTHTPLTDATVGASWMNIGVSNNNNTLHELDKNSIKKNGSMVTFRDRKTLDNPDKSMFSNMPEHKTSLNVWEINCKNKTYTLVSTRLFNKNGQQVYTQDIDLSKRTFMGISRGSAIEKQYDYVCK
jgi:hypothetical protein